MWQERQVESFTKWINFTFMSTERFASGSEMFNKNNSQNVLSILSTDGSSCNTQSSHALNMLVQKRAEATVRRKAYQIFHSEMMVAMQCLVEEEISDGRLAVRTDKHLYADVGLQEEFINLVCCCIFLCIYCFPLSM